jgi:phenylacetate-coenzyme A ligase PaaK-like adenylate-forming protein
MTLCLRGPREPSFLVSVLFSRTQPLIRYELSDSVVTTDRPCPCGRTFRLIEGVQGRREDVIHLPSRDGGSVSVHPNVFHDVLESGAGR